MMPGIYHRFETGTSGAAGAHAHYITRVAATEERMDALVLHNYPEEVSGESYRELRDRVVEYNRDAERAELGRKRTGGGQTRTHYKVKLSFEGKVGTEIAAVMAREYLEKNFPMGRGVATVHQDTDNTHIHINLQARQVNDRKIQLRNPDYKKLDQVWAQIYAGYAGREVEQEHLRKKEETREWKRDYARGIRREKPQRVDRGMTKEDFRRRDQRNYDKEGIGRNERNTANRERASAAPAGDYERALQTVAVGRGAAERAARELERAVREAKVLGREVERSLQEQERSGLGRES